MNSALQAAFVLLLFYLPGALALSAFTGRLSTDKELPVVSPSVSVGAAFAFLLSVVCHGIAAVFLPSLRTLFVDVLLLSNGKHSAEFKTAHDYLISQREFVFIYLAIMPLATLAVGWVAHWVIIVKAQLDRRFVWLRFKPQWHYLLAGYESAYPDEIYVEVDIVTELNHRAIVYSGVVTGGWFDDQSGALETIGLGQPTRFLLDVRSTATAPHSRLPIDPSGQFIVKFSEAKNINIRYVRLAEDDTDVGTAPSPPQSTQCPRRLATLILAGILGMLAASILWLVNISSRLDAEETAQKTTASAVANIGLELKEKASAAAVANIQDDLSEVRTSVDRLVAAERPSLQISPIFFGREHPYPDRNRAVRVKFEIYNAGRIEATRVSLSMLVDGHHPEWAWDNSIPEAVRGDGFALSPGRTVLVNAITPIDSFSPLGVKLGLSVGYSDASGNPQQPISTQVLYSPDWKTKK